MEARLGKDYIIECMDDSGWWGEPVSHIYYGDDVEIVMGDETGQVLQINLNSSGYTTNNGDKVGDKAEKVLPYYQEKYPWLKTTLKAMTCRAGLWWMKMKRFG